MIPSTITKIGNYAFCSCPINTVTIPSSVKIIGEGSFSWCTSLVEVSFQEQYQLTYIGKYAFQHCEKLKNIKIPSTVEKIDRYAFSECGSLMEINIPYYVDGIEDNTFQNCDRLEKITFPYISYIGEHAFSNCNRLKDIELPDSLIYIEEGAFNSCAELVEITIPPSVEHICSDSFEGCENLTKVRFLSRNFIGNVEGYFPERVSIDYQ